MTNEPTPFHPGRIPSGYRTGTWRGTLPIDPETNELGICFNIEGYDDVLRIRIKAESAKKMVDSIIEYLQSFNTSQKDISSSIPSSLGSIPDGGQKV